MVKAERERGGRATRKNTPLQGLETVAGRSEGSKTDRQESLVSFRPALRLHPGFVLIQFSHVHTCMHLCGFASVAVSERP